MKFIRQNKNIIIFLETASHADTKRYFNIEPETAGFAQSCIEENGFDFSIYGDSKGLRISSDPENDEKILKESTDFSPEKPLGFAVSDEYNELFLFPVSEIETFKNSFNSREDVKYGTLCISTEKETDPYSCRSFKAVPNILTSNKELTKQECSFITRSLNR